jgi:putative endopeptidase
VALSNGAIGEAVGAEYVARLFPPEAKAQMDDLVANLVEAYRISIGRLEWMGAETRERALTKLQQFRPKVGYPPRWRDYSALEIVADDLLGNVRRASAFETARQLVTGASEKPPRFKRCIDQTTLALSEMLGKAYVDKHFPVQSKQNAVSLIEAIAAALNDEIGTLDWMSEETRKTAQDKLAKLVRMVGFPDKWKSYDFDVKRDDFAGNWLRAAAFEVKRQLAKAGKPYDRSEWPAPTFVVDAFYNASGNNMMLPAGILQPPFFGAGRSIAANLGGIGMVIGHELTNGFDDQGAQFDAAGNWKNWWKPDDKQKFDDKGKCLVDQYGSFEAAPKQYVNGALTVGENNADLGGVKMAFKAYRSLRKDAQKVLVADGFTEDQQFFLAVGQAWCFKMRRADAQRMLATDNHAPPNFRVYGALRNLPEFSQAFQCAPGTPMHPAQTCSVW